MKNLKIKKVKKTALSKIYGGKIVSSQTSQNVVVNGEPAIKITSDSFDDKDDDGKWDSNESGNKCVSYL